jgi:hypothetical protein
MKEEQSLLPCPFCGGDANIDIKGNVVCVDCPVWMSKYSTKDPITKWNTRTPIAQPSPDDIETADNRKRCTKGE